MLRPIRLKRLARQGIVVLSTAIVAGYNFRASSSSAQAPVQTSRTASAVLADSLFWRTLHGGSYEGIPRALYVLQAAYLENPADWQTSAHLAFLHAWRIAERARLEQRAPTITDEAILARNYFERSIAHNPDYDARIHGFDAVFQMVEADIHRSPQLRAAGLSHGRQAIKAWPEFNWFTIGYVLSTLPDTSALFREGLEMQWKTVDACGRTKVDRANPTASIALAALEKERDPRHLRACTNTWIAPHNMEGFFLNMGDMEVKSGNWQLAQKVYMLAKGAHAYESWPYRDVLEARIADAQRNVASFRDDNGAIMFRSKFACSACHQTASR
jgi:hypothetical protein